MILRNFVKNVLIVMRISTAHIYIYINISMLTIASIWCKNMYAYLSANINCSKMRTVFQEGSLRKNHELVVEVRFENCEPIVDIRFENWGVSLG